MFDIDFIVFYIVINVHFVYCAFLLAPMAQVPRDVMSCCEISHRGWSPLLNEWFRRSS